MADITTTASTNVTVNGEQAKRELSVLEERATKLRATMKSANDVGDTQKFTETVRKLKDTEKEMRKIQRSSFDVKKVLDSLSTANLWDIRKAISATNKELAKPHIKRKTEEYEKLCAQLKILESEYAKVRAEQKGLVSDSTKTPSLSSRFNIGALVGGLSIAGVMASAKQFDQEALKMSDSYADVMKTTGLTAYSVDELNDAFKRMDTRTSREQLNALATAAGKLNYKSKEDILEFVDAANQIDVALGEDLGDNAVQTIGKIADVFSKTTKEMDSMGIKERMLSIASAINEIGSTSSASEAYLVDFAGQLGGMGVQAGLSIQNILGYASVLDQSMQSASVSSTAFNDLLSKMSSNTASFAKVAGLEVKEFSELMKNDMNSAILLVLKSLSQKGGLQELQPILTDLKITSSGASATLTSLAANIDKITQAQKVSNSAFAEGISITDEYNTRNNSAQGQREKATQAIKNQAEAIGRYLNPVFTDGMKVTASFMSSISYLLGLMSRYSTFVTSLVLALITYVATTKSATISTSFFTIGLSKAKQAVNALTLAFKKNPILFIGSIIIAATAAIYDFATATDKLTAKQKALNDATKEANTSYEQESWKIKLLTDILNNENIQRDKRQKALDDLKEIVPSYHASLSEEGVLINNNTKALDEYLKSFKQRTYLEAIEGQAKNLQSKIIDKQKELKDAKDKGPTMGDYISSQYNPFNSYFLATDAFDARIEQLTKEKTTLETALTDLENAYKNSFEEEESTEGKLDNTPTKAELELESKTERLKALVDKQAEELQTLRNSYQNKEIKSDEEFIKKKEALEKQQAKDKTELLKTMLHDGSITDQFLKDSITDEIFKDKKTKTKTTSDKSWLNKQTEKEEIAHISRMTTIKAKYKNGEIDSEAEYHRQLQAEQDQFDKERLSNLMKLLDSSGKLSVDQRKEILKQISSIQVQVLDRQVSQQNALRDAVLSASPLKAEKEAYDKRLQDMGLFNKSRLEMTKEQQNALNILEKEHLKRIKELESPIAQEKIYDLDKQFNAQSSTLQEMHNRKLLNERQFKDQMLLLESAFLRKKLDITELNEQQRIHLLQQLKETEAEIIGNNKDLANQVQARRGKPQVENLDESMQNELAIIQSLYDQQILDKEAMEQAKLDIEDKYRDLSILRAKDQSDAIRTFSLDSLQELLGSYSQLASASNQADIATINKKYDDMVKSAGTNQTKIKKIEEQRDAELKQKNKENAEKSFKIQIAQALASTAQAAISAYGSAAAVPVVGHILAPIAAATATMAGMMQIATIKKQRDTSLAQYWTGGFTPPGHKYGVAGEIHYGEFVGNKESVQNPVVNSVYRMIDTAQKNNTVAHITADDFANQLNYRERMSSVSLSLSCDQSF